MTRTSFNVLVSIEGEGRRNEDPFPQFWSKSNRGIIHFREGSTWGTQKKSTSENVSSVHPHVVTQCSFWCLHPSIQNHQVMLKTQTYSPGRGTRPMNVDWRLVSPQKGTPAMENFSKTPPTALSWNDFMGSVTQPLRTNCEVLLKKRLGWDLHAQLCINLSTCRPTRRRTVISLRKNTLARRC